MSELTALIPLVKQYGPYLAVILFFIWKDWKREVRSSNRIEKLEDEFRNGLLTTVMKNSEVVTKNTGVLTRVEKRLDDWQLHIAPSH
jgi:hypothetical protein